MTIKQQTDSTVFRDIGEGIGRGLVAGVRDWPKPAPEQPAKQVTSAITITVDSLDAVSQLFTTLGHARQIQVGI